MYLDDKKLKLSPSRVGKLKSLGLKTAEELLTYYPYRYEVRISRPFSEWREKDKVFFEATVCSGLHTVRFGRKKTMTRFDVLCDEEELHITIFNRPWTQNLESGSVISIQGIYNGKNRVTAISYAAKRIADLEPVQPVYSVKAGIQQRTVRACIEQVLNEMHLQLEDRIPAGFRKRYLLLDRETALRCVHFPKKEQEIAAAYRTLKYEEFLQFFLAVKLLKQRIKSAAGKKKRTIDYDRINSWMEQLPFALTPDQNASVTELFKDMESDRPMYRLLQGDVGSGKTVVAAAALYACVTAGFQSVLLAPTEILARQHYESLCDLFRGTGVRIGLLYAAMKDSEKQAVLEGIAAGSYDIVTGTHSLLQDTVTFNHLGLVAIDEQQRFGVHQRKQLRDKGINVDFLLLSATPIPRTLASALYGDMDISSIHTMPSGRQPIQTVLIKENSFRTVLPQVEQLLAEGRQLYCICSAIEERDGYKVRNINDVTPALQKLFAGRYTVGCLHGRMSSDEKREIMKRFASGEISILVSTTVVEVGINVVNATGMIIYDANCFGLSQLHQLRGRIRRGSQRGICWLLSGSRDEKAIERLEVLVRSYDGFEIAYEDLRLRGPGDMLGKRQSGFPDFVLGNPIEDQRIVKQAEADAETMIRNSSDPEYAGLIQNVLDQNKNNMQFVD